MQLLEMACGFVMNLSAPFAEYLSEKLADRFGHGGSLSRRFVIQALVFTLFIFPLMLVTILLLAGLIFMLHWLFTSAA
tara:strand:+ start:82332 stop:82565 length:234 start_codon:yes stop_codon:yes gene_type:complete